MPRVRYRYILSLPERVIRSAGALSGGLLREIGNVALPMALRRTALYRTMVEVALRFLIEEVGEVEGIYPTESRLAENFLLQRSASHGIELLGIAAFQASPIWVLAALADATGGSRKLIAEIAQALKDEKLLDPDGGFETMEQVLDGLEKTSEHLAVTLNLPPTTVPGLRKQWTQLIEDLRRIPPRRIPALETVERLWTEVRQSAEQQGRSVFMVSSLIALSTVRHVPANVAWLSRAAKSGMRATGKLLGAAILDHYVKVLGDISSGGYAESWRKEFRPYLHAAAEQFAPEHESLTERFLRKHSEGIGDRG